MKNEKNLIQLCGSLWKIHSATETKIVLKRAVNPVSVWRQRLGINQRAAAAKLGISQPQLARIERGTRIPSSGVLAKLK